MNGETESKGFMQPKHSQTTHHTSVNAHQDAGVAKLVDVSDLGSDVERRRGSSPLTRTKTQLFILV